MTNHISVPRQIIRLGKANYDLETLFLLESLLIHLSNLHFFLLPSPILILSHPLQWVTIPTEYQLFFRFLSTCLTL
jgi:hypothetical protein